MGYEMVRAPLVGDIIACIDGKMAIIAKIPDLVYVPRFNVWKGTFNDTAKTLKYDQATDYNIVHWQEIP
jgi:hypothetical protein